MPKESIVMICEVVGKRNTATLVCGMIVFQVFDFEKQFLLTAEDIETQ